MISFVRARLLVAVCMVTVGCGGGSSGGTDGGGGTGAAGTGAAGTGAAGTGAAGTGAAGTGAAGTGAAGAGAAGTGAAGTGAAGTGVAGTGAAGAGSAGSGSDGGAGTGAAGTGSDGAAGTPATPDGSADAATSTCMVPDAGGMCNALVNNAPNITIGAGEGEMPVGTGGTFVDGTYFLTEMKSYVGSPVPSGIPFKQTFVLSGCTGQLVEGSNVFKTFTYAPAGIVPNWQLVCSSKPNDANVPISSYTATPTSFSIYSSLWKFYGTYTKQ
jgi:hypothetical protein